MVSHRLCHAIERPHIRYSDAVEAKLRAPDAVSKVYWKLMMESISGPDSSGILRVSRTRDEARQFYDKISRYYDYFTRPFEGKLAENALGKLSVSDGETVLEIGSGTGHNLKRIAQSIGVNGNACGIDLSAGMISIAWKRLHKAGYIHRVELLLGDAASLPFRQNTFEAAFLSFTLELFDTPQIPGVLAEIRRVLKPDGRLAITSMSRDSHKSLLLHLYEWAHRKWPKYIDCRPINVAESVIAAGYTIRSREMAGLCGLPVEIVVAVNAVTVEPT